MKDEKQNKSIDIELTEFHLEGASLDSTEIAAEQLETAFHLLQAYISRSSSIKRFFNGDWKLAHTDELKKIISDPSITSLSLLVQRLNGISLNAPTNVLETTIKTIKDMLEVDSPLRECNRPIHQAIAAFLNHFDYLDTSGHRKKTFSSHFKLNHQLTQRIEASAVTLQNELHTLLSTLSKLDDESQFTHFLNTLNTALRQAWQAREDLGECDFLNPAIGGLNQVMFPIYAPEMASRENDYLHEYKTPYAPGKFEENLIKGLCAADAFLIDDRFKQKQLQTIITKIKTYSPAPIFKTNYDIK